MLTVRPYSPADFDLVNDWWRARHGQLSDFPQGMIPALAIIVESDGLPVFFIVCYETFGCGIAWIEYPVSNPTNSLALSRAAFRRAVTAIIALAGKACKPPGEFKVFRAMPSTSLFRAMRDMGFRREYPDEHVPVIFTVEDEG